MSPQGGQDPNNTQPVGWLGSGQRPSGDVLRALGEALLRISEDELDDDLLSETANILERNAGAARAPRSAAREGTMTGMNPRGQREPFPAPQLPDNPSAEDVALMLTDARARAHQLIDQSVARAQEALTRRASTAEDSAASQAQRHAQRLAVERVRRAVAELAGDVRALHARLDNIEALLRQGRPGADLEGRRERSPERPASIAESTPASSQREEREETEPGRREELRERQREIEQQREPVAATAGARPVSIGSREPQTNEHEDDRRDEPANRGPADAGPAPAPTHAQPGAANGRGDLRPEATSTPQQQPQQTPSRPIIAESQAAAWPRQPSTPAPLAPSVAAPRTLNGGLGRETPSVTAPLAPVENSTAPAPIEERAAETREAPAGQPPAQERRETAPTQPPRSSLWTPPSSPAPSQAVARPRPVEAQPPPPAAPEPRAETPAPTRSTSAFTPEGGSVMLRVSPISGFQGLMRVQDAVVQLREVREAAVEAYARGEAQLRIALTATIEAEQLAKALGESLGQQARVESASIVERTLQVSLT